MRRRCKGPSAAQLYARIGEPGHGTEVGHATTVNIAGSSECATSDACNVTEAITYQGAAQRWLKGVFYVQPSPHERR